MNEAIKRMMETKGNHEIHPLVAEFSSTRSLNVLKTFGYEAPDILNDYSCKLEDVCLAQKAEIDRLTELLRIANEG